MKLTSEEQAMLSGEHGSACKWALEHMLQVGRQFDAQDFVPVSQAHMMGDPESLGEAGVRFLERLVEDSAKVAIPTITDPRGVDLTYYRELGQTETMASLERRIIKACSSMGILLTNTCICYQTILPPVRGDHVAFGDTGVVIYTNSVLGAYSNFEGGPSALAAGLTGRTPRYGPHLDSNRCGTMRFIVRHPPRELTDWGVLGGIIGRAAGSYWEVPVLEGIDTVPTSDELKHFGAAMASYGSVPLFHIVGVTPEAGRIEDVFNKIPTSSTDIAKSNYEDFRKNFSAKGEKVDVVVFAAPQLSLMEISQVAALLDGRRINKSTALFVCTSPGVASDCDRMGLTNKIETCGGKLLRGTCFYQQFAREIAQANGWYHLVSNSAKIVNIIGGYGYKPSLASMEKCVESAIKGVLV